MNANSDTGISLVQCLVEFALKRWDSHCTALLLCEIQKCFNWKERGATKRHMEKSESCCFIYISPICKKYTLGRWVSQSSW